MFRRVRPETEHGDHGVYALARDRDDKAELHRAAALMNKLRASGMGPHEIVAAFRARRRMRTTDGAPSPRMIGQLAITPILPDKPLTAFDGMPVPDITMMPVYRGDGDD